MNPKLLLALGWGAVFVYALVNIVVPAMDPNYNWTSLTISELSAIGAPTRTVWTAICSIYSILFLGFAIGVLRYSGASRSLKWSGMALTVNGVLGLYWPPMHQRIVIASGGGTLTDSLHIVWAMAWGVLIVVAMGCSAASFDKRFRVFAWTAITGLLVCVAMTSRMTPGLEANLPTPWMGVWERTGIIVFLSWMATLAWKVFSESSRFENSRLGTIPVR